MELLLINHPLDCPICDKGGECPLQNQAMSTGRTDSRFVERKREFPKPMPISTQVLLDRERCVLCQRCTRFSEEIAGDPFIDLMERGAQQQIGVAQDKPFQSLLLRQHHPDLPGRRADRRAYRFRARPFDLVSTPSVCEHCASGLRAARRQPPRQGDAPARRRRPGGQRGVELRQGPLRASGTCRSPDRITRPMVRGADGVLGEASWTEALRAAAEGLLRGARRRRRAIGVLTGGRLTVEDAYAYAKFARVARRHQRHRLPGPPALRRGAGVPRRARRRAGTRASRLRPRSRPRRPCCAWRSSRRRRPDRLPAAAQGRPQAPAEGLPPRAVDHPGGAAHRGRAGLDRAGRPDRLSARCPAPRPRCSTTWPRSPRTCSRRSPAAA